MIMHKNNVFSIHRIIFLMFDKLLNVLLIIKNDNLKLRKITFFKFEQWIFNICKIFDATNDIPTFKEFIIWRWLIILNFRFLEDKYLYSQSIFDQLYLVSVISSRTIMNVIVNTWNWGNLEPYFVFYFLKSFQFPFHIIFKCIFLAFVILQWGKLHSMTPITSPQFSLQFL